jgi:hypothetical protein
LEEVLDLSSDRILNECCIRWFSFNTSINDARSRTLKICYKIQLSLKSDSKNRYFTRSRMHIYDIQVKGKGIP